LNRALHRPFGTREASIPIDGSSEIELPYIVDQWMMACFSNSRHGVEAFSCTTPKGLDIGATIQGLAAVVRIDGVCISSRRDSLGSRALKIF